jgi:hypothetical protein
MGGEVSRFSSDELLDLVLESFKGLLAGHEFFIHGCLRLRVLSLVLRRGAVTDLMIYYDRDHV